MICHIAPQTCVMNCSFRAVTLATLLSFLLLVLKCALCIVSLSCDTVLALAIINSILGPSQQPVD